MAADLEEGLLAQMLAAGTITVGGESHGAELTGTRALMYAVLEGALQDYRSGRPHLQAQAEAWIGSARRLAFSFTVVCETLGLDPSAVRAALTRWRQTATPLQRRLRPYAYRRAPGICVSDAAHRSPSRRPEARR